MEDLRWVLIKSIVALGVTMLACLIGGNYVVEVLKWPLKRAKISHPGTNQVVTAYVGTNRLGVYTLSPEHQQAFQLSSNRFVAVQISPVFVGTNLLLSLKVDNDPDVHNRVETIEAQAEQLRRMLPDVRIVVGHGQMPEGQLEKVMLTFASGAADILVCTTIIESGLDIPNANTIVIDRADQLGLAQLYQLRGRVGRSSRRAYAYLLYRRRERMSEEARKRLQAIFNASELGAGFQIALSDLEIRGAGNLLGAEQHGNIAAVGFELFTRLLAEAVEDRKAELEDRQPVVARPTAVIDLPVDAYVSWATGS